MLFKNLCRSYSCSIDNFHNMDIQRGDLQRSLSCCNRREHSFESILLAVVLVDQVHLRAFLFCRFSISILEINFLQKMINLDYIQLRCHYLM